jgi:2-polyprenyl-3-methyl-5-hydroxy-6-metoxy-1,4-benzoquinol methylase
MDYKNKIYEKYYSVQASHIKKRQGSDFLGSQFIIYDAYYQKYLPRDKNAKIIDIACGDGSLVNWLNSRGYGSSQGIDISEEQIALAKECGIKNISQEDCFDFLPKHQKEFDAVFALDVLEHFPKTKAIELLQLIFASLKPNGTLVFKTPNGESIFSGRYAYGDLTHETIFTCLSLREAFALIGFSGAEFQEAAPVIHGLISFIRFVLWQIVRVFLNMYLLVEVGRTTQVLTQNIIGVAKK